MTSHLVLVVEENDSDRNVKRIFFCSIVWIHKMIITSNRESFARTVLASILPKPGFGNFDSGNLYLKSFNKTSERI